MKWKEMSTGQKILTVIAIVCLAACILLQILGACNILSLPKAVDNALLGTALLCLALLHPRRGSAIMYYICAALYFLCALLHCF